MRYLQTRFIFPSTKQTQQPDSTNPHQHHCKLEITILNKEKRKEKKVKKNSRKYHKIRKIVERNT